MRVRAIAAPVEAIRQQLALAYSVMAPGAQAQNPDPARATETVQSIVERASERRASDIHIEPSHARTRIRLRIDGVLVEDDALARDLGERVVARIKLLAGMDIADKRLPQDGRCTVALSARGVDLRVASMPTIHGEKLVIRLLDRNGQLSRLDDLGMSATLLHDVRSLLAASHGLIVVCGPTGSGKTTTLYASLLERSHPGVHVCTLEDPVEMQIPEIVQVQVNERTGLTFAAAMRAMVRQDPDIVMIGEMRDPETAQAAVAAALAGRLVMTTLHCADAAGAIDRIVEFGISRGVLAHAVVGVLGQRLVRCDGGRGRRGRTGVFEYLPFDEKLRAAVEAGAGRFEMRAFGRSAGYRPLSESAKELVTSGVATESEIARVLGAGAR
jgi:type II secretory ATPase GspE/PulE/Tfp pilus assembly ATPase PilB-like protein